jgi:ribonucleoside-diphosphate reductase beta chain
MKTEKILVENSNRYVLFPLDPEYMDIWDLYKKSVSNFWTVEEVNLEKDRESFETLSVNEQNFIKNVLAFFASSDGIVNENLVTKFYNEIQIPEIRNLYSIQIGIEAIHSEMYSLLIDCIIKDNEEKHKLFNATSRIPSIKQKAEWAQKWISNGTFAERLLAFLIMEGVFFSSSFCSIYWIKTQNKMPGLCKSNEWIARDEGMHALTSAYVYKKLENKLTESRVHEIFREAIDIEINFVRDSLPINLLGMNSKSMESYVKSIADFWCKQLGYGILYGDKNPFDFMETLSVESKQDFFIDLPSNYQMGIKNDIDLVDEF